MCFNNIMTIIYILKIGDKGTYIGKTKNLKRRIRQHVNNARKGWKLKLYQAIRDNDYSFDIEELEICNEDISSKLEQAWITNLEPNLNTNNAWGLNKEKHRKLRKYYNEKKNYCKCCKKIISASNWAKHVNSEIHKKNLSNYKIYDSVDGFSEKLCKEEQDELCTSDEKPGSEISIQQEQGSESGQEGSSE